jgi:hypothetical protein
MTTVKFFSVVTDFYDGGACVEFFKNLEDALEYRDRYPDDDHDIFEETLTFDGEGNLVDTLSVWRNDLESE